MAETASCPDESGHYERFAGRQFMGAADSQKNPAGMDPGGHIVYRSSLAAAGCGLAGSTLGELEALAGFLLAVLLAFNHSAVTGEVAAAAERVV